LTGTVYCDIIIYCIITNNVIFCIKKGLEGNINKYVNMSGMYYQKCLMLLDILV